VILSDAAIRGLVESGRLVIRPFDASSLTPNGVDLSVGEEAMIMEGPSEGSRVRLEPGAELVVPPGSVVLILSEEYLELPPDVVGMVNLRSTWARRGLLIPPTIVDAGYRGRLTLAVRGPPYRVSIRRGERVWHLVLAESRPAESPYRGRYQGSMELATARE
jgi:dCTP deaminase